MSNSQAGSYYLPDPSHWPLTGSIALTALFTGAAMSLNGSAAGVYIMGVGAVILLYMLFGWFGTVIRESVMGRYNRQVDISFRWSMGWFIFSEVMFFAAFFGALFYARVYSIPWLGGAGSGYFTQQQLWPEFQATWPLLKLPSAEGFREAAAVIGPWGIPALNTLLLLSSGITVTLAHWALRAGKRTSLALWLLATVVLGLVFLGFQVYEYGHAYSDLNLTLNSGMYGSLFFMLTGFHGLHVTLGVIMLFVVWLRCLRGHFSADNHFAFEAVSWYWHFVDVVWLFLFVVVYWL